MLFVGDIYSPALTFKIESVTKCFTAEAQESDVVAISGSFVTSISTFEYEYRKKFQ